MSNSNKRLVILTVISMMVYCGNMQAQSDSRYTWKSASSDVCIKHIEITPAQYAITVTEPDTVMPTTARIKHDEATPNKSRFSLANKVGRNHPVLRTGNHVCSTEITLKNQQDVFQDTKAWPVTIREDVAVIDFSRLPNGLYTVSVKTRDGLETFKVRYR